MSREVKVCVVGNMSVGKSCLSIQYVNGVFNTEVQSTIGAAFLSKSAEYHGSHFKFQIWDTAGAEKYRGLAPMYYRGSNAAILVYDITDPETFEGVKIWVEELKKQGPDGVVLALAGNKCDLEDQRQVSKEEGADYATSIGATFFETSAVTGANVDDVFKDIASRLPTSAGIQKKNIILETPTKAETEKSRWRFCTIL